MSLDGANRVEEKAPAHRYRPTVRSLPWLVGFLILPLYEVLAIVYKWDGGALSHLFWWAYGDRGTVRWWLLSFGFCGWSAWCCWHFALRWPGLPQLLALVALGLLIGAAGYLITHQEPPCPAPVDAACRSAPTTSPCRSQAPTVRP